MDNKIFKICFLTESFNIKEGWGRYSIGLVGALNKQGIKCLVLTKSGQEIEKIDGVEVKAIIKSSAAGFLKYIIFDYWRIKKYVRDCDFVHVLTEPYALLGWLCSFKKPFYLTAHGTMAVNYFNSRKLSWLFKIIFKKAKKIFAVSNFTKKKILERINLDNIVVINNGIDLKSFGNFQKIKKQDYSKIILSVGIYKERKGYHISIPAVAKVKETFPDIKYYIVGSQADQNYFIKLQELVKKYNLVGTVEFFHNLTDNELKGLYQKADLFLLTPINLGDNFEGFGLVYLEAGFYELPVIGTFGCGAEEAIENNKTGILVPQGDIEGTAMAIKSILSQPEKALVMGQTGRKKALNTSWDDIIWEYLKKYGEN